MPWVEVFAVLIVSHLVGDYLFQTDWQATHKHRGLGADPVKRRALFSHVTTYTMAYIPALVWLSDELGALSLVGVALAVFIPHLIQDDGRLIATYVRTVKGDEAVTVPFLLPAVDQTLHIAALFALALAAGV